MSLRENEQNIITIFVGEKTVQIWTREGFVATNGVPQMERTGTQRAIDMAYKQYVSQEIRSQMRQRRK